MNFSTKRTIYVIFCSIVFIVGFIGLMRYTYLLPTYTATIMSVDDIREMGSTNPLYRDYYEEDITVSYNDDKEGTVTITERFKQQLPEKDDTVSVYQMENGSLKEKTSDTWMKYFMLICVSIWGLVMANSKAIKGEKV